MHTQADHHHRLLLLLCAQLPSPLPSPISSTIAPSRPDPAEPKVHIPACLWTHLRQHCGLGGAGWELRAARRREGGRGTTVLVLMILTTCTTCTTCCSYTQLACTVSHGCVPNPQADHQQQVSERVPTHSTHIPHPEDPTFSAPCGPIRCSGSASRVCSSPGKRGHRIHRSR